MNEEEGKKKTSFLLFYDWESLFAMLNPEDRGQLITALFAYEKREELPEPGALSPQALNLFTFLSKMLEENKKQWKMMSERGTKAGKASGESRRNKAEQEPNKNEQDSNKIEQEPNKTEQETNKNEPKDKVKEKVKEKEDKERVSNDTPKKSPFSLRDVPVVLNSIEIVKDHPEIKEIIYDFYKMRQKIKKPLSTESALRLIVERAVKLGDQDPDKIRRIFENSVANSWQGVFKLKEEIVSSKSITQTQSNEEFFKQLYKEAEEYDRQNNGSNTSYFCAGIPGTVQ